MAPNDVKKIKKKKQTPAEAAAEEKEYYERARRELFPKVKGSAFSLHINASEPDPKICMELGAMILFDKPIIVLVPNDTKVSANLRRVATTIIEGDLANPSTQEKMHEAMTNLLENDARISPKINQ